MSYDYQCELKLKSLNPHYSELIRNTAIVMTNILDRYRSYFPEYTDHSSLHSLQVINFCNLIIGDQIDMLNEDELLILLFSCYFHDTGMGISEKDYKQFHDKIVDPKYISEHPNVSVQEQIRSFHQEFSASFIKKYAPLFEIPSEEHVNAVIQVSRGHRKTDLFDPKEYPADYMLPTGNIVCLPFLASLIRLADELDIAEDRNIFYEIPESNYMHYMKHVSIKHLDIKEDCFELTVKENHDEALDNFIESEIEKLQETLDYCCEVCEKRTKYRIKQKKLKVIHI